MFEHENNSRNLSPGVWLLILFSSSAIIITLAFGAAFTGIQTARQSAAKASLGHIESVLILAEYKASVNGYGNPGVPFSGMLKSYGEAETEALDAYSQFVLDTMLEVFGEERDFDFAVSRYDDGGGHTIIYFFPVKGKTDLKTDKYYMLTDNIFSWHNT